MRYYELTINTKEADSLLEKMVSYLPNPPIKQQKNPSFLALEFYSEPEKIQDLEKKLKSDSLRYMILVKEPQKEAKPRRRAPIEKPSFLSAEASAKADAKATKSKEKKVDLKEVDKKIEEMLKE